MQFPKGWGFWIIIVLSVIAAGVVFVRYAKAHGPAEWIQRGNYTNAAGQLCCGERDCAEMPDGAVTITPNGYHVRLINRFEGRTLVTLDETIPFNEAAPSPDGKYWRCQWGGARKCFFAPPPAM